MEWLEVCVLTDGEGAEAVAEALRPFAYSEGVVLEQLGDMSTADPDALEETVTVKIYLPQEEDTPQKREEIETVLFHLGRLYPIPPPRFDRLKEQDWANAWKAHYKPFRIGNRLWIQPSWLDQEPPDNNPGGPDHVVLTLDPGMAFGTGLHPTTQMCLQFIEQFVRVGDTVLDVGTGSGILAIAAAMLGATSVSAFDTDVLAVKTADENARINGVDDAIDTYTGTLADQPSQKWDVVLVNILAPVIIQLFEKDGLMDFVADGGVLVLSGIIDEQLSGVETALQQAGGKIVETRSVRDWVCLAVQHDR